MVVSPFLCFLGGNWPPKLVYISMIVQLIVNVLDYCINYNIKVPHNHRKVNCYGGCNYIHLSNSDFRLLPPLRGPAVLVFSCISLNWVRPLYRKVEPRLNKLLVEGRLTMVSFTDLHKIKWYHYINII